MYTKTRRTLENVLAAIGNSKISTRKRETIWLFQLLYTRKLKRLKASRRSIRLFRLEMRDWRTKCRPVSLDRQTLRLWRRYCGIEFTLDLELCAAISDYKYSHWSFVFRCCYSHREKCLKETQGENPQRRYLFASCQLIRVSIVFLCILGLALEVNTLLILMTHLLSAGS